MWLIRLTLNPAKQNFVIRKKFGILNYDWDRVADEWYQLNFEKLNLDFDKLPVPHHELGVKVIKEIGFDSWFEKRIDPGKTTEFQIARIFAVNKDNYLIRNENSEVFAELSGRFLFHVDSSLDFQTVGDCVYVH